MADTSERFFYSGVRGVAVKILNRIERTDSYLDRLLEAELRNDELNDMDKGLLNELVHGVLRWQLKLDWVITGFFHGNYPKSDANVRNALRVALYQILFLDRIPASAAVNEAVEMVKRVRGQKNADMVNGILRNIGRNVAGIRYPVREEDPLHYLSVVYSHPQWMVRRWLERFGLDGTEALLRVNNEKPPLTIRVNLLKSNVHDIHALLTSAGIEVAPSKYLSSFLRVSSLGPVGQHPAFQEGTFTVQDESAGLACKLLAPRPGDHVIDMCAAPGGKSAYLAEMMQNRGEIVALDRYDVKLRGIQSIASRLGISIISTVECDAEVYDGEKADRVLLDAPCSGLGVLSKKPDIKWKREIEDVQALAKAQTLLLENAARLVKPGGALVYSTCTIEPEENSQIINTFIQKHAHFEIEDARHYLPAAVVSEHNWVETFPHLHSVDGSFAVRLKRKE